MKKKLALFLTIMLLLVNAHQIIINAESAPINKKILIIHSDEEFIPANIDINKALVGVLKSSPDYAITLFSEYLDSPRLFDKEQLEYFKSNLIERYSVIKPDLVIAVDYKAYQFLLSEANALIENTPLVFCMVPPGLIDETNLPENITGNYQNIDASGTIDVILEMHPKTTNVLIVSGAGPSDIVKIEEIKKDLLDYKTKATINFIENMSLPEMENYVAALSSDTVILYNAIFEDVTGAKFIPREALMKLNAATSVPIYGTFYTNLNYGLTGGSLFEFEGVARDAANRALAIFHGASPSSLKIEKVTNKVYMNWALFKRWHIDENELPQGAIILNQEFTVWEEYRFEILGTIFLIVVLTFLLFYLSLQLRLKRKAETALVVLNEQLENKVEHRTEQLKHSNDALQDTNLQLNNEIESRIAVEEELTAMLDTLNATQQQLITAEKQAGIHLLVRNLLHRINTPLGSALSYSDLLFAEATLHLNQPLNDSEQENIAIITNLRRSQDKIRIIMDTLEQMIAVESDTVFEHVNLREFIAEVILKLSKDVNNVPLVLVCYPDVSVSIQIKSFEAAIHVLIEYAKNCRKQETSLPPAELLFHQNGMNLEMIYQDEIFSKNKTLQSIFDPYAFSPFQSGPSGLELVTLYYHITIGMSGVVILDELEDKNGIKHTVIKMIIPIK